jgi:hypothetical protein
MTIYRIYAMRTSTHLIEFGIVMSLVYKLARMEGGLSLQGRVPVGCTPLFQINGSGFPSLFA